MMLQMGDKEEAETREEEIANPNEDGGDSHQVVAVEVLRRCQLLVVVPINKIMRKPFIKIGKTMREGLEGISKVWFGAG